MWLRPVELVREGAELRLGRCRIWDFIKRGGEVVGNCIQKSLTVFFIHSPRESPDIEMAL